MKLTSGLRLETTKGYTIRVADGSEPRDLIDVRDNGIVKNILSSMARVCDSDADVAFVMDKVTVQTLAIDVYSVDMYVETNTDILVDELNALMAAYPSRVQRRVRIRTTRRPDVPSLYATRVHVDITTHDYALMPASISVCHIYSPAIPLKRNAITGMFGEISSAGDVVRDNPQRFVAVAASPERSTAGSWSETFGSIFGHSSSPSSKPREPEDFILLEGRGHGSDDRPFKRPRVATPPLPDV